jgi:hypothetical protein
MSANTSDDLLLLQNICPLLRYETNEANQPLGRKKRKAKILTSTPNKEALASAKVPEVKRQFFSKRKGRNVPTQKEILRQKIQ